MKQSVSLFYSLVFCVQITLHFKLEFYYIYQGIFNPPASYFNTLISVWAEIRCPWSLEISPPSSPIPALLFLYLSLLVFPTLWYAHPHQKVLIFFSIVVFITTSLYPVVIFFGWFYRLHTFYYLPLFSKQPF